MVQDLIKFGEENGFSIPSRKVIVDEAVNTILSGNGYPTGMFKKNFDHLILDTEAEAHRIYRVYEKSYGENV